MKIPEITRIGLIAAGTLLFNACAKTDSGDVTQSTIFTSYDASYDAAQSSLKYSAHFNVGGATGTYVALTGDSAVTLDGNATLEDTDFLNQVTYHYELASPLPSDLTGSHTFVYVNNDGDRFTNHVPLPGPVAIASVTNPASLSAPLVVNWTSGDPIGDDHTLTATLIPDQGGQRILEQATGTGAQSGQVTFAADRLRGLSAGAATIKLCRSDYPTVSEAPAAGGAIRAEYCSATYTVSLIN